MFLQITTPETVGQAIETVATQGSETISVMNLALKGGWIMIPLLLLFAMSIYIFIERLILINQSSKEPDNFMNTIRDFVHNGRLDSAQALCANTNSPIARMIGKGISRIGKPLNDINVAIENVGKFEVSRLERRLAMLSTAAGAGPMIGFLGTVTGMVRVFFDMASKGNNIDVGTLSGGMYEAMVTTVGGLIVGITAYICYNYLVSRIEKMVFVLEARATEFMDLLHEPVK
ncbi:MAG: MotA/TolQ/ExbB proton channel family protein [Bacteroidales bacterium]|jgi:biopolymer transport protein ExbB|nr:MotA/TolQ/ExbB proton channel family protein [Bacteroidales bacterium]